MVPVMDTDEHILETQLRSYCGSGIYPMHMPGHKRNLEPAPGLPSAWDVTEVPDTDDLHHADGILRGAMDRTARLWGSRRTWYLVNGSTCGILAAIYALVPAGGELIAARSCHKSVFHAIELLNLTAHWLLPPFLPEWEICGSIPPAEVEWLLREHPAAKTVIVTSPTYEGIVSDIAGIAAVCHAAGARLIVDEAHGAHLGLLRTTAACSGREPAADAAGGVSCSGEARGIFPDSALHLGADVVIQSAHKTLPSLTQTALLHLAQPADLSEKYDSAAQSDPSGGDSDARQDREEETRTEKAARREAEAEEKLSALERSLEHALDIFETSSPSYPLMASLDGCTGILANRGEALFAEWERQIRRTEDTLRGLQHLRLLRPDAVSCDGMGPGSVQRAEQISGEEEQGVYEYDRSRFLLRAWSVPDVTGEKLSSLLRGHGIEPEMYCGRGVLLMSGCGDSAEGWERLRQALAELDEDLAAFAGAEEGARSRKGAPDEGVRSRKDAPDEGAGDPTRAADPAGAAVPSESGGDRPRVFSPEAPETAMTPAAAQRRIQEGRTRRMALSDSAGSVSAEYVMAYPPGIPILVPGERITLRAVCLIRELARQGTRLQYSASPADELLLTIITE